MAKKGDPNRALEHHCSVVDPSAPKASIGRVFRLETGYDPELPQISALLRVMLESCSEVDLHSLGEKVSPRTIQTIADFEIADIQTQVAAIRELVSTGVDVPAVLRSASVTRKLGDTRYLEADESFIDPTIWNLMKGHMIEGVVEVPRRGDSRHQSDLFRKWLTDAERGGTQLIGLDSSHRDIDALELEPQSVLLQKTRDKAPQIEVGRPTGVPGLLQLIRDDPDHSGFVYGIDAQKMLSRGISHQYDYRYIRGTIQTVTGAIVVLEDGIEIEKSNFRIVHIVGADTTALLDRAPDEIYLRRKCRLWINDEWRVVRIVDPHGHNGLIDVEIIETGKVCCVGRKSVDLDLRDPDTTETRMHPLQEYPHIRHGRCIRFEDDETGIAYGYIEQILTGLGMYHACTTNGFSQFRLDEHVTFINPEAVCASNPLMRRGNKLRHYNFKSRKQQIFEIMGYDIDTNKLITRIVSLRTAGETICSTFDADDTTIEAVGNDADELFKKFPLLETWKISKVLMIRFIDSEGIEREGHIFTTETLPFYIEVLIEKSPDEMDYSKSNPDSYHRFDVAPEAILDVFA